jgi:nitroreductase
MVRNFRPDPVEPEIIQGILDLARRGPSAGFSQGQAFIVITDPAIKVEIARLCQEDKYVAGGFDPFISGAPVLVVPCTNEAAYHRRYQEKDKVQEDGSEINWPLPYWFMDVGCAVMLVLLAVVDRGLAAGFAGVQDLQAFRDLLNIPREVTPVGVIPIGVPAEDKRSPSLERGRRDDREVFHWDQW